MLVLEHQGKEGQEEGGSSTSRRQEDRAEKNCKSPV